MDLSVEDHRGGELSALQTHIRAGKCLFSKWWKWLHTGPVPQRDFDLIPEDTRMVQIHPVPYPDTPTASWSCCCWQRCPDSSSSREAQPKGAGKEQPLAEPRLCCWQHLPLPWMAQRGPGPEPTHGFIPVPNPWHSSAASFCQLHKQLLRVGFFLLIFSGLHFKKNHKISMGFCNLQKQSEFTGL